LDLEVVLLIGAAVVGIVVGLLHLVGYVPPRYRRMLKSIQADTAKAIGDVIDARLATMVGEDGSEGPDPFEKIQAIFMDLPNRIGVELRALAPAVGVEVKNAFVSAQTEFAAEMAKPFSEQILERIPPQVTGAIGGLTRDANRKASDLRNAIGEGLLGPYGALLSQFMPPLYEYLVANPDMVVQALEMPVVQKLIQKAAAMAGKVGMGGGGETVAGSGIGFGV